MEEHGRPSIHHCSSSPVRDASVVHALAYGQASLTVVPAVAPIDDGAGGNAETLGVGVPADRSSRREGLFEDSSDVGHELPIDVFTALEIMPPLDRLGDDRRFAQPAGLGPHYLDLAGTAR